MLHATKFKVFARIQFAITSCVPHFCAIKFLNQKTSFMNYKNFTQQAVVVFFSLISWVSHAQITTFATGLPSAIGISRDAAGNLWVGESGTGNNDGKIVMVNTAGTVFDVITQLPSFLDTLTGEVAGPWRANKEGNDLKVVIGGGEGVNAGTIATFDLTGFTAGDPAKTIADATSIIDVQTFALANGFIESDPYSYAYDNNGNMFICDAAANAIIRHDAATGVLSQVHTFAPILNIYTPFPPYIDYVPTKIIANPAGGFYVCNLTGFPFIPGISTIDKMDVNGNLTPFASGLSHLVDMDIDAPTGDVYALQFGLFDTTGAPVFNSAKIIRLKNNGDTSTVIGGFGPSGGMVLDGNGGAYVTSLFMGAVLHIDNVTTVVNELNNGRISEAAFPNPFSESTTIHLRLEKSAPFP